MDSFYADAVFGLSPAKLVLAEMMEEWSNRKINAYCTLISMDECTPDPRDSNLEVAKIWKARCVVSDVFESLAFPGR